MRILLERTEPPIKPTSRRHNPRQARGQAGYRKYRACLRWDFGFTCPFCLLHEADLAPGGCAEGTGLTWIEHILPQSSDETAKNKYPNCVYSCRFCNRARSNRPVDGPDGKLLDPTKEPWAKHFTLDEDQLRPTPGNADARYTYESYDLDDPRKVTLRRWRRKVISHHRAYLADRLAERTRLSSVLQQQIRDPAAIDEVSSLSCRLQRLSEEIGHALDDLEGYAAIPEDAPTECRCGVTTYHTLPEELERQTWELPAMGRTSPS